MLYQYNLTKFNLLKELNEHREQLRNLNKIFLLFGAPYILHTDKDLKFAN